LRIFLNILIKVCFDLLEEFVKLIFLVEPLIPIKSVNLNCFVQLKSLEILGIIVI